MAHFVDNFDSDKDVLYGMGKWIHYYIYNYYHVWKGYLDPTEVPGEAPEELAEDKWKMAHDAYQKNVINIYNEPIKRKLFSVKKTGDSGTVAVDSVDPDNLPTDPILQAYFRSLERATGFGPESLTGPLSDLSVALSMYEKGPTYAGSDLNSKTRGSLTFIVHDIAIRRSCKFGVDFFSTKGTVHYILDELDIGKVVRNEMVENQTTGMSKVPICTSELLYIFRQWQRLSCGPKVRFWCNFEEVPPPWQWERWSSVRPYWAMYAVHRFDTYRYRIPQYVQALFRDARAKFAARPNDPATALTVIRSFHRLPTAYLNLPHETGVGAAEVEDVDWHLVAAPRPPDAGTPGLDD